MALSNKKKKTGAPPTSFLTKLAALREFVNGMGVKASEDQLSNTLKNSGYNVELALERILTGNFGTSGGAASHEPSFSSAATSSTAPSSTASKKRSSYGSSASSSSLKTPKSSIIKRQKSGLKISSDNSII